MVPYAYPRDTRHTPLTSSQRAIRQYIKTQSIHVFFGSLFSPYYLQNFLNLSESNIHKTPSPCSRSKAFLSFLFFFFFLLSFCINMSSPNVDFPTSYMYQILSKCYLWLFLQPGAVGRGRGEIYVCTIWSMCVWLKSGKFF